MTITMTNHKPAVLFNEPFDVLPVIDPTVDEAELYNQLNKHLKERYIEPMFESLNPSNAVSITSTDSNNNQNDIDIVALEKAIHHLWQSDVLEIDLHEQIGEIYRQGMQYSQTNDWFFEKQLTVEAITRMKLPLPTQVPGRSVTYSAQVDVIPTAKGFLAQPDDLGATNWFANIGAYVHDKPIDNYLLLTVQSNNVLDQIKQEIRNNITIWQSRYNIDTTVLDMFNDFGRIDLSSDLSTGLFLPNNSDANKELSFSRILMYSLANFEKNQSNGELSVQPVNIEQVYMPENIIILNLENYAHAYPKDIRKDWEVLTKAIQAKQHLKYISNKKLMTAAAVSRSMSSGGAATPSSNAMAQIARAKNQPFSGKPITAKESLKMIQYIIKSNVSHKKSENSYKTKTKSMMRQSRRRPDDVNAPGKRNQIKYRPDIHIYIDTSGSISEEQYRDAVTNLIVLARQINCNIYVTSFSHVVSQTSKLITKDRSVKQIYKQFLRIPKVTGGTNFMHVWRKIDAIDMQNQKTNSSYQLNFIITDFGYTPPRSHRWSQSKPSLKNTYYVPISTNSHGWNEVKHYAESFKKYMALTGDVSIRKRMLM